MASYIRRDKGRGAAPFWLPIANPSRPLFSLHLHHLRHPSRRAAARYTPSLAAPPLAVGLLHHVSLSLLLGLAKPYSWEVYTINSTTTVVVPRSI